MSFWEDKRILITGAGGFVGLHLLKGLIANNAKVITFSPRRIPNLDKKVLEEIGVVEDFKKINSLIKKNMINTIFHLAAQPIVEVGQTNPIKTFEVNIKGTWNVLEAARENSVQKVIIASTLHVYGENPKIPYKEEYYPQPSRPYETSKACADLLAQVYADSFSLPVEIPRFVNIYGPGDLNFSRLIPKIIRAILKGENPKIWDKELVRDFLFIDDAIRAYLMLAEKNLPNSKRGRVFNIGTGRPINIIDLAQIIIDISKKKNIKLKIESIPGVRTNEVKKQYASVMKAKKELGWFPRTSLKEGLRKTFMWYQENSNLLK